MLIKIKNIRTFLSIEYVLVNLENNQNQFRLQLSVRKKISKTHSDPKPYTFTIQTSHGGLAVWTGDLPWCSGTVVMAAAHPPIEASSRPLGGWVDNSALSVYLLTRRSASGIYLPEADNVRFSIWMCFVRVC